MDKNFRILTEEVNDMEADLLVAMLRAYGIDARKEFTGASGVVKLYIGTAVCGVRIIVPRDKYDEAVELMNSEPIYDDSDFDNHNQND